MVGDQNVLMLEPWLWYVWPYDIFMSFYCQLVKLQFDILKSYILKTVALSTETFSTGSAWHKNSCWELCNICI